jgi:DNA polymerase (family 10)
MARPNEAVAALLQEYADLLSITGGDGFRARVYDRAARSVAGHHADLSGLDRDRLQEIPNVGGAIADKILEYLYSGRVEAVERLRAKIPAGVRELTAIPTLGPRKAMVLYRELGVSSVPELARAIEEGRLAELRGFGAKTTENLRHGIELLRRAGGRVLISTAMAVAEEVAGELSALPGCVNCTYAGSLRRMRESIGDVEILAASRDPAALMDAFTRLPLVAEVIMHGPTRSSVRSRRDLPVDLRVVTPEVWGAALQYLTGSKAHNTRTREIAARLGLALSEYGLVRVEDGARVVAGTEQEVYEQLGLPWIPPTLREDRGEIEAALAGELPDLVTVADIRGDLHTHTDLTDGVASLAEMLAAARTHGYEYYAVTDHAKNLPMQRMTDQKMLAQRVQLRAMAAGAGMALLHGTELNLDRDGAVDWEAGFLSRFDICVASVHSHFQQSREQMTRRLVRACENPYVNIIGHPMTRQIGRREPVDADFDAVFEAAARTGTALEVNSFPDRLDLNDELIHRAKRFGVRFAVNTDAHATGHLDHLRYGVGMAQRGWLTAADVINAWPLPELRRFVAAKRRPQVSPSRLPEGG